jgi:hypothetical protein
MIAVELACRADGTISLIREDEIRAGAPEETQAAREPLRWEAVSIEQGRRERWTVVPDGVFGLLAEVRDHRSIRRKFKAYYDGWRAERHIEQFGLKQMRVC